MESLKLVHRFQIWSLDKKLRVIRTAKDYVKRHESDLQAQLAQDKTFGSRLQQARMQIVRFFLVIFSLGHILHGYQITFLLQVLVANDQSLGFRDHALAATHQRHRVPLWVCRVIVLHFSSMDILDEPDHHHGDNTFTVILTILFMF